MKALLYLGAAIAVLRSVTAYLPNHNDQHNIYDQQVFQPDKAVNSPAVSSDYIEVEAPAPRFGAGISTAHQVASSDSDITQPQDDMDLPLQGPRFPIGTTTSQWAITYTPYSDSLTCLTPDTIRSDAASIGRKGFTTIRLYSTDCSILQHIEPALRRYNLTLIMGITLDDGLDSANTQLSELIAWATPPDPTPPTTTTEPEPTKWPLISLLLLGTDAIFSTHVSPHSLATFITRTRTRLHHHAYQGPITTTEPLSILSTHSSLLCPVLDIPAATIQPYFHPSVSAPYAGAFLSSQLSLLSAVCPNLVHEKAIALEAGWPSRGRENGEAVPGAEEQVVAVAGMMEEDMAGGRVVFLGWRDEGWRSGGENGDGEGEFGVEGSWGCGHVFGERWGEGEEEGEGGGVMGLN